jgi:hypothetical protein
MAAAGLTLTGAAVSSPGSFGYAGPYGSGSTATQVSPGTGPFRFAVIGDFGAGTEGQQDVADRMCRWRNGHAFDLVITTGDNIYPDGARRYFQDNFFTPYDCLLSDGVAFHATLGNHDVMTRNGRPELNEPAFGLNGRSYVLRRRGVRFVMVDSNNIRENWLRRRTKPEPGDRWTVVAFHHPVYSPGDHGPTPGFRPWMPRLFKRRGVDLVFNGHDHFYAVSKPLGRIRYVVTGGGGAELRGCFERWYVARCVSRHHFLYVRAGAEWLWVEAVPRRGAPFHKFRTRGRD